MKRITAKSPKRSCGDSSRAPRFVCGITAVADICPPTEELCGWKLCKSPRNSLDYKSQTIRGGGQRSEVRGGRSGGRRSGIRGTRTRDRGTMERDRIEIGG